jgi:hypothetical protein
MEVFFMTSAQPAQHESTALGIGDPVIVREDGWSWSETEKRTSLIVRFPDSALTQQGWFDLVLPQVVMRRLDAESGMEQEVQLRARRWRLDVDKLTPARKAVLFADNPAKEISTTDFTIRDLIDKNSSADRVQVNDRVISGRI